jgi:hypothetical protein
MMNLFQTSPSPRVSRAGSIASIRRALRSTALLSWAFVSLALPSVSDARSPDSHADGIAAPASRAGNGIHGCLENAMVTNADDSGSGSLRQAVLDVCQGGVIDFSSRFEIQLLSEIAINTTLTIDGTSVSNPQAGADQALVQIKGGADVRAFNVGVNGDLTLVRVRISNGVLTGSGIGGGILNAGTLNISECRLDGNQSGPNNSFGGGAIRNTGNAELYVERSTFDHNVSHRGAAIFNSGDATLVNSTFSANTTDNGASVREGAIQNRGTLTAVHITVTGNGSGGTAGGLFAFESDTILINSIFAGNNGNDCVLSGGTFNSVGLLKQTGSCPSQLSGDPRLGALADNGGVTATHALLAGSAAIGAGDDEFCADTDQRSVERADPLRCDAGAFEFGDTLFKGGFE